MTFIEKRSPLLRRWASRHNTNEANMKHLMLSDGGTATLEREPRYWRLFGWDLNGRWLEVIANDPAHIRDRISEDFRWVLDKLD